MARLQPDRRRAVREERIARLQLAYFGNADVHRLLPVAVDDLPRSTPATGWIAVSETYLQTDRGYAWLKAYTPMRVVGKSIALYHILPARASRRLMPGGSNLSG